MSASNDSVPVIAYHQICNNSKITPALFEEQMRFLKESGYSTVSLDEFHSLITGKNRVTGKHILITFDDGFADNLIYAYPILKKYGFTAVVFLITSRIRMTDEVRYTYDDYQRGDCGEGDLFDTAGSSYIRS